MVRNLQIKRDKHALQHYKMYKAKKSWVLAGMSVVFFGGMSYLSQSDAYADVIEKTPQSASSSLVTSNADSSSDVNVTSASAVSVSSSVDVNAIQTTAQTVQNSSDSLSYRDSNQLPEIIGNQSFANSYASIASGITSVVNTSVTNATDINSENNNVQSANTDINVAVSNAQIQYNADMNADLTTEYNSAVHDNSYIQAHLENVDSLAQSYALSLNNYYSSTAQSLYTSMVSQNSDFSFSDTTSYMQLISSTAGLLSSGVTLMSSQMVVGDYDSTVALTSKVYSLASNMSDGVTGLNQIYAKFQSVVSSVSTTSGVLSSFGDLVGRTTGEYVQAAEYNNMLSQADTTYTTDGASNAFSLLSSVYSYVPVLYSSAKSDVSNSQFGNLSGYLQSGNSYETQMVSLVANLSSYDDSVSQSLLNSSVAQLVNTSLASYESSYNTSMSQLDSSNQSSVTNSVQVSYQSQLTSLQTSYQSALNSLTQTNGDSNTSAIASLNAVVMSLQNQISSDSQVNSSNQSLLSSYSNEVLTFSSSNDSSAMTSLNAVISSLQSQVSVDSQTTNNNQSLISSYQSQINSLNSNNNVSSTVTSLNSVISSLQTQSTNASSNDASLISSYQSEVNTLLSSGGDSATVNSLTNQITSLQSQSSSVSTSTAQVLSSYTSQVNQLSSLNSAYQSSQASLVNSYQNELTQTNNSANSLKASYANLVNSQSSSFNQSLASLDAQLSQQSMAYVSQVASTTNNLSASYRQLLSSYQQSASVAYASLLAQNQALNDSLTSAGSLNSEQAQSYAVASSALNAQLTSLQLNESSVVNSLSSGY